MGDFSKFFQPKSIAFVGATADESKLGGRRFRSLVEGNFKGEIFPVNPGAKSIRGIPAFRNLREIPSAVDLAVIVVPTDAVLPTAGCRAVARHHRESFPPIRTVVHPPIDSID